MRSRAIIAPRGERHCVCRAIRTAAEWPRVSRVRGLPCNELDAYLTVEGKKLEALVDAHRRFGAYSLELFVRYGGRGEVSRVTRLLHESVDMTDQGDKRHVRPNGEENGVVDIVRRIRLLTARLGRRKRDELLLEPLNSIMYLVDDVPQVSDETEERSRIGTPRGCGNRSSVRSRSLGEPDDFGNAREVT